MGRENTDNTENSRKKYGHLIGLKGGSKCKYFKEYKTLHYICRLPNSLKEGFSTGVQLFFFSVFFFCFFFC